MKIIISAGGTGGHLYPALALAEYIKTQEKDVEFLFVGTTDRLESKVVPQKGYEYRGLNVKGFVGNPLQKIKNVLIFVKSLSDSKRIIKQFKPDIVIGFGGYPSASIVLAASMMGVKTMIHEQNSIIGLTNKILINRVDRIVCCYKNKTVLLGNPRASVVSHQELRDIHDIYGIDKDKKTVVVVMGSLGSSSVNNVMKEALTKMQHDDYHVIYVTGQNYYESMKEENLTEDKSRKLSEDGKKYIYVESNLPAMSEKIYEKSCRAVEDTRGMYMVYEKVPVIAPYFAVSAGKTRNGNEVFAKQDYPYLQERSVRDVHRE